MLVIPCSPKYTNSQSVRVCKETGLARAKELRSSEEIAKAWSVDVFSDDFGENTYMKNLWVNK